MNLSSDSEIDFSDEMQQIVTHPRYISTLAKLREQRDNRMKVLNFLENTRRNIIKHQYLYDVRQAECTCNDKVQSIMGRSAAKLEKAISAVQLEKQELMIIRGIRRRHSQNIKQQDSTDDTDVVQQEQQQDNNNNDEEDEEEDEISSSNDNDINQISGKQDKI
ncbi:MAG: hypothetical protein EZS28_013061 [Streblomastix strix]|uniref:Uncharacterized protein n=1 Tax=Streblomastix strix TaxID=222440 RepID=A0A5J4W971_9EUKA|nr:MAG: hypothetical protein EZS28_013061 [Streblomastix strix]